MSETLPFLPRGYSLTRLFLAACLLVMSGAMLVIGNWVQGRIGAAAVQNSANAAAMFMESFVSPLSQDLAEADTLSEPAARALTVIFEQRPMGARIEGYKIWKSDGLVVHASDASLIGQRLPVSDLLARAWEGSVAAELAGPGHGAPGAAADGADVPLLEVYSPVRELWSGEIIAVAEFYIRADRLSAELAAARRESWLIVGGIFVTGTLLLVGIVHAGDRLIRAQARELEERVRQSEAMAALNRGLRARVVEASARATAQTDRSLRRLGAELHDGPAQYLALAALRLDSATAGGRSDPAEVEEIRKALGTALAEIRSLSRGLVIPDIENLRPAEIIERAAAPTRALAGVTVGIECDGAAAPGLGYSARLCLYRFVQETLSNAARHAPGATCSIRCRTTPDDLRVTLADDGPGFDPDRALGLRSDGGQGLPGLRDRAESLGGLLEIDSAPGRGTRITLVLPLGKETSA